VQTSISKTKLDRLGDRLRKGDMTDDDFETTKADLLGRIQVD